MADINKNQNRLWDRNAKAGWRLNDLLCIPIISLKPSKKNMDEKAMRLSRSINISLFIAL